MNGRPAAGLPLRKSSSDSREWFVGPAGLSAGPTSVYQRRWSTFMIKGCTLRADNRLSLPWFGSSEVNLSLLP
jgi:hypothetical protein